MFYTDFLQKWEDGLYHAFPSNIGEDGFDGTADSYYVPTASITVRTVLTTSPGAR